jgi:enoyl-CoA hydratase/carnithine racemase
MRYTSPMTVRSYRDGPVTVVTIDRPDVRNAVDRPTSEALARAFVDFEADDGSTVAVLTGAGGTFCSGADLKATASGRGNRVTPDGDGPMGPTRMALDKPVIAAIEGHAVAGGLELANALDGFPPICLRGDRRASYEQWGLALGDALAAEYREGVATIESGETRAGAARFAGGDGRHGQFSS